MGIMDIALHSLIIIGSGPAALTAAIYAARALLTPVVIEGDAPGGQLMGTTAVENWPGNISTMGPELMRNMKEHALHYGAQFLQDSITQVDFSKKPFTLITRSGKTLRAQCVIVATGASPNRLKCPGEDIYWGKGVTVCAVCDGFFYKDKKVIVVGGGDTAMEDASFLTKFTSDITVVQLLDHLTASEPLKKRVLDNPAIKVIYNSTVAAIEGNGAHVTSVTLANTKTGKTSHIAADGVFIAIGLTPNTGIFKGHLELTTQGYMQVTDHTRTSVQGIFAAGDVADYRYRQAITAAGSGCMAALDAERYLKP